MGRLTKWDNVVKVHKNYFKKNYDVFSAIGLNLEFVISAIQQLLKKIGFKDENVSTKCFDEKKFFKNCY